MINRFIYLQKSLSAQSNIYAAKSNDKNVFVRFSYVCRNMRRFQFGLSLFLEMWCFIKWIRLNLLRFFFHKNSTCFDIAHFFPNEMLATQTHKRVSARAAERYVGFRKQEFDQTVCLGNATHTKNSCLIIEEFQYFSFVCFHLLLLSTSPLNRRNLWTS